MKCSWYIYSPIFMMFAAWRMLHSDSTILKYQNIWNVLHPVNPIPLFRFPRTLDMEFDSNIIAIVRFSLYGGYGIHNPIMLWNFGVKCVDKSTISPYLSISRSLACSLAFILSFSLFSFTTCYKMYLICKCKIMENHIFILFFIWIFGSVQFSAGAVQNFFSTCIHTHI